LTFGFPGAKPWLGVAANRTDGDRMRTMTLLLCLGACVPLAACAGASASSTSFAPEPAAQAAAVDPPLLPGPTMAENKPSRGARGAKPKADDADKDEWWKEGGITREKINAMCWMKFEKGRADLPLEKRADLVNACVAETLKEHPL
jgi:hypothetical protein